MSAVITEEPVDVSLCPVCGELPTLFERFHHARPSRGVRESTREFWFACQPRWRFWRWRRCLRGRSFYIEKGWPIGAVVGMAADIWNREVKAYLERTVETSEVTRAR
jgi:hypothetical protein